MAVFHEIVTGVQAGAAFIVACASVLAVVKGWPKWLDHKRTIASLNASLERERIASEAARNYRLSSESWEANYKALVPQLEEIQRAQVDTLNELRQTKGELAAALIYITEIIRHFSSGGSTDDIPPVPESIQAVIRGLLDQKPAS